MRAFGLAVPADRGLPLFQAWKALRPRDRIASIAGTARRIWRLRLWRKVVIGDVRT
jgi:coenzyme F420 hydrogenase subunit beta